MADGTRKRILIVDDNETHMRAIREMLELEGYEVYTSSQSMGTSKLVITCSPDLILMDVNMPTLAGDRLVSALKRSGLVATIPVVFHSGNEEAALRELTRQCGAAGYIKKGDPALLRAKVAAFLRTPLRTQE